MLDQRDFYNACLRIETEHGPEAAARRVQGRRARAGPRARRRAPRAAADRRRRAAARRARVLLGAADAAASGGRFAAVRARAAARARPRADAARRPPRRRRRWPRSAGVRRSGAPGDAAASRVAAHAARRRRRQHPDALRRVPRRRGHGHRALAVRDRARVDRRRARRGAVEPARAARPVASRDVDDSIVSSTVPQLSEQWTRWPSATWATRCWSSGPTIRTGMPIRIDNPHEVGADRLVNAVAAYDRVRGHVRGRRLRHRDHLRRRVGGGRVPGRDHHPGAEISIDALYERAAKLPKVELARAAVADRQVDRRRDPQRDRLRLRRPGRGDRPPAARRARRRHCGDRDRRPGRRARAVHPRDDRRGRRPAHADRAAADLGAEPRSASGSPGSGRPASGRRSRPGSGT